MIYIGIIVPLLAVYVCILCCMGRIQKKKTANFFFFLTTYLFYILYLLKLAKGVGIHNYYFHESLATANISPFMFSIMPLIYFSKGKLQKYLYLLVSLLSVGMLLSPVGNALSYAIKGTTFGIIFVWDYIAHLSLSLWGVYLVKSGQVQPTKKDALISSAIIFGICDSMLLLNLVFDTSFFGLSLRGKHHIYYNVLVENSYLSALLYFLGLCAILCLGYLFCHFFATPNRPIPHKK